MISGRARLAGVIGWPVGHSLSPRLHGHWLDSLGIDGAYVPLPVHPDDLSDVLRMLPRLGFAGANLTVPHKEAALARVDVLSPEAARIGAVNTLVVGPDGRLEGRNTDAYGFMANLRAGVPDWRPDAGPAVVIGAGGAARAVCVALQDAGVPAIRLANRTLDRARSLAADLGPTLQPVAWNERAEALSGANLLVNTTSLGMRGQPPLDLDLHWLPAEAAVNDIVYAPLETPLLAAARARGNPTIDGLGMLLHQAVPGFEAWFGIRPEVTPALRDFVLQACSSSG